jgi:hypothetical protein
MLNTGIQWARLRLWSGEQAPAGDGWQRAEGIGAYAIMAIRENAEV